VRAALSPNLGGLGELEDHGERGCGADRCELALEDVGNRYEDHGACSSGRTASVLAYGVTIRDKGHREHVSGQANLNNDPKACISSWPPLRPTWSRRECGSAVVVSPTGPVVCGE
jgi:hypothetical protein